jgi:hypothetical protein
MFHVFANIFAIYRCSASGWWVKPTNDAHCGSLASSVVTKQCQDLNLNWLMAL